MAQFGASSRRAGGYDSCVNPLNFLCPHCSAYQGNPCLSNEGVPMKGFHAERKQITEKVHKLRPERVPEEVEEHVRRNQARKMG